MLKSEF